jgi:hypothetical protein
LLPQPPPVALGLLCDASPPSPACRRTYHRLTGRPKPGRPHPVPALPLALVGIAFSSEEGHGFAIFDVLRTIYDIDHFVPRTNGLTHTDLLGKFFEGAVCRIPITPDFNPNLCSTPSDLLPVVRAASLRLLAYLACVMFPASFERASKRQLVAVRIGHVEIPFSPRGVSRTLWMKSPSPQVCPEGIHVLDVEN